MEGAKGQVIFILGEARQVGHDLRQLFSFGMDGSDGNARPDGTPRGVQSGLRSSKINRIQ
ncbi:hypothetical protein B5U98_27015 [Bosea sp. Tri-39]|nr:hypothetical protein BLM15_29215 [Bosea sp. Tri-49]RXT16812.1 hypothetical protein B5U98_27015 [Bosea sp. Tri-39]RXT37716.1 hypothetical protein B5U99_12290 [Bosea sp. Tri-54]